MEPILAFDIETYGAWGELSPEVQGYLQERDRKAGRGPDDPGAVSGRVGLLPGLAQVIAIGLWSAPGAGTRLSLVPDLKTNEERTTSGDYELIRFRKEADLLHAFWKLLLDAVLGGQRLVSFNGRRFDGPMLMLRSAVLGETPSVNLSGKRSDLRPHCDLSEVLSFFGASRNYSLDYWCSVYGVASPKGDMNGAGVAQAYEEGNYDKISRYALGDAMATGEVFRRLEDTLIAVLEAPTE